MWRKGTLCANCGDFIDWIDHESGRSGFWYHIVSGLKACSLRTFAEPKGRGRHLRPCEHEFIAGTSLSDEYSPAQCKHCGALDSIMAGRR